MKPIWKHLFWTLVRRAVATPLAVAATLSLAGAQSFNMPRIPAYTPPPSIPHYTPPPSHYYTPPPPRIDTQSMRTLQYNSQMNRMQIDQSQRSVQQTREMRDHINTSLQMNEAIRRTQEFSRRASEQMFRAEERARAGASRTAGFPPRFQRPMRSSKADAVSSPVSQDRVLTGLMSFQLAREGAEFYFTNDPARKNRWVKGPNSTARNLVNGNAATIPGGVQILVQP